MKNEKFTGDEIVKFGYEGTGLDLNYGKIVGRRILEKSS